MASLQSTSYYMPNRAVVFPSYIPTLSGLAPQRDSFSCYRISSRTMSIQQMGEQTQKFIAAGPQRPELGQSLHVFDPNYPADQGDPRSMEKGAHGWALATCTWKSFH
jgi:hypothetical protein